MSSNFDPIKKPHRVDAYSKDKLAELMKCTFDPIYFIEKYIKVQHPIKGQVPLKLYDFQVDMVNAFHNNRFVIGLTGRQQGKCLTANALIDIRMPNGAEHQIEIGTLYRILPATKRVEGVLVTPVDDAYPTRKFEDVLILPSGYSIKTDTGYQPISKLMKTIPYVEWELELDTGNTLVCADTHIMFRPGMVEVFAKDLRVGDEVVTEDGIGVVSLINETTRISNMFDIEVDSDDHRFYANGILHHNTTTAGAYLLWKAMFVPDTKILLAANKLNAALEIMSRVRYGYEECPDFLRAGVTEYNKGTISFDNGSSITARATTPDAGRGLSITLLYLDEFAFVRPTMASEFWTAIQPVLSTGGSCIITSTPNNDEDQFAQIWKGASDNVDEYGNTVEGSVGSNGFFPIKATWDQVPGRDEAWAKPFRESLGDAKFRQEFCAEFITDDETLVDPLTLSYMKYEEPIYYTGQIRWFKEPEPNKTYFVSLDPCLGTGRDYAAIQIYELPGLKQVGEWQHNKTPPKGQVRYLLSILKILDEELRGHPDQIGEPTIYWTVENNSIGEAILVIIEDTGEYNFPGTFVSEKKKPGAARHRLGLNTDNRKKLVACSKLKSYIESRRLQVSSRALLKQLKNFVRTGASYAAKPGENDDLVMSLLLIVRMVDTVMHWLDADDADELKEGVDPIDSFDAPMPFLLG